jgi:hypothetical protein
MTGDCNDLDPIQGRFFCSIMSPEALVSVQTPVKWVARALSQAETVSSPPASVDIKGVYITVLV